MSTSEEMTRDHWWWRPGWRQKRSFYAWHITFPEAQRVHDLVSSYSGVIGRFATLEPVTLGGLHLTVQGIGFTDEVSHEDISRIVSETRRYCAQLNPFQVALGPAIVDAETIQMPVEPASSVSGLRMALRNGIGDVWGYEGIPESADGYRPHVTLAYSCGSISIDEIEYFVTAIGPNVATTEVTNVSLIDLNRDRKRYEWNEVATVNIGA